MAEFEGRAKEMERMEAIPHERVQRCYALFAANMGGDLQCHKLVIRLIVCFGCLQVYSVAMGGMDVEHPISLKIGFVSSILSLTSIKFSVNTWIIR